MKDDIETNMMNERLKLEEQLNTHAAHLGTSSKNIGTGALIVGGILVLGYIVGKKFLFPDKKGKSFASEPSTHLMVRAPKNESAIVRMLKEQMTMFLIAIVKERLTAYINAADKNKK
jgi:hypothetical protein